MTQKVIDINSLEAEPAIDPDQARALLEADRQHRGVECSQRIQAELLDFSCEIIVELQFTDDGRAFGVPKIRAK